MISNKISQTEQTFFILNKTPSKNVFLTAREQYGFTTPPTQYSQCPKESVNVRVHLVEFSLYFYKEDNICDFMFALLHLLESGLL